MYDVCAISLLLVWALYRLQQFADIVVLDQPISSDAYLNLESFTWNANQSKVGSAIRDQACNAWPITPTLPTSGHPGVRRIVLLGQVPSVRGPGTCERAHAQPTGTAAPGLIATARAAPQYTGPLVMALMASITHRNTIVFITLFIFLTNSFALRCATARVASRHAGARARW